MSLPPCYANPPTKQPPASLPSPLPIIGCSSFEMSFPDAKNCRLLAGCAACLSNKPGQWESKPFRKGWCTFQQEAAAGGGVQVFMLHILWIGAHGRERETVQAHPPTKACECTTTLHTIHYRTKHTRTHYDPLSYLPDKIHARPLHLKIPFYSTPAHPLTLPSGRNLQVTFWERERLHTRNMGGTGAAVEGHA